MRYFVMIVAVIFVLGCVPYSDHPLTDPDKGRIDSTIFGTWFWKEENESGYIHIGLDEKSKLLRLIMVEFDRDGELVTSEYSGHTSSLAGNTYLNLQSRNSAEAETRGYLLVKYKASQDSLGFAFMDNKGVETAIKGGTLKGQVKEGQWMPSVRITEGQKELQEFILRKDKELFPEMQYLPRLKLPNQT